MKRLSAGLMLIVFLAAAAPAPGQFSFLKKPKVNPSQRVPELILTVKTDADERKRQSAAEALRDFDTATFTEIVPVLVDVLQNDKKLNVRLEALGSLAKIRPVTQQAGQAIEKAAADDESWRVRLQAKTSLPKYYLAGYSKKSDPTPTKTTAEPPLAEPGTPNGPRPLPKGIVTPKGPSLFP